MYCVFLNESNGSLILISKNHHDYFIYLDLYTFMKEGKRKECIEYLDNYREESHISEEEFMYLDVK